MINYDPDLDLDSATFESRWCWLPPRHPALAPYDPDRWPWQLDPNAEQRRTASYSPPRRRDDAA